MLTFTVIIFVVAYLIFTYTGLGSRLKAIGAGETAARFAGIRLGIIFLIEVALFSDRKTGMIVK